jgi:hypothetical protein
MSGANKYTVHTRIAMLENAVTELKKENAELRTHLAGKLETLVNDKARLIQAGIRIPQDGKDGRNGVDGVSITGPQGAKGDRGDCLIPSDSEVAAALQALRLKLAKWQAAVQFAYEQNYGTKHRGLKVAIDNTLKTIENQAR